MFSPLQVISSNSLLQSSLKIEDYVKRAHELGYQSVALSDIDVMYGVLDFYHACQKYRLKPIIGITLAFEEDAQLMVFAKNIDGYHHLLKLSSLKLTQHTEIDFNEFLELSHSYWRDLVIVSPAQDSIFTKYYEQAPQLLTVLNKLSDPNSIYLGVDPLVSKQETLILNSLAKQTNTPLIAASAIHYLHADNYFETHVLRAIGNAEKLDFETTAKQMKGPHYLREPQQYLHEYERAGLKQAFDVNQRLCEQLEVTLEFPKTKLPHFKTPSEMTAKEYLAKLCREGLRMRINTEQITDYVPYVARLKEELDIIHQMGFDDYFLIVWDVTNFAHQNQIRIGPGRGSAAGSLVSYVLKITDVDPLKYGLLFERFLNPKRAQMPDIDLDIPDAKRNQIIKYVHEKYGHEHMAQIITFGTLGARQALRDVGRVLGLTNFELDQWSKAVPHGYKVTLKEAYEKSQKVRNLVVDSQRNELLFKTALKLEGLPRHYSTHAAGVILSDQRLSDLVPVQLGTDQILLSQFAKNQVEEAGLLKIDFLGLRNLTILDETLKFVKKGYSNKFDLKQISFNDPATLKLFQAGKTNGIFQFESFGIKNVLRQLHPTSFEDIAAVNALYRPGPMNNIETFIARKHGKEAITYPVEKLASVLKNTYGIIVYQEQVMQVATVMGNFSLGQADLLRRAISKKDHQKIAEMQNLFVSGALQKGYRKEQALKVYEYMQRFGDYGFNRSHAIAYSKMAFELAYLKVHYSGAFFAALLNSVAGNDKKIREYLAEAKQFKLTLRGPDINVSQPNFTFQTGQLLFGLNAIKTLRGDLVDAIIAERSKNGKFTSLTDFIKRLNKKNLKEEQIQALIYAGVFDTLEPDRSRLLTELPQLMDNISLSGENQMLFTKLAPKEVSVLKLTKEELLAQEFNYLGTYVSGHPIEKYQWLSKLKQTVLISELIPDTTVQVLVYVKNIRVIRTKKGEQMAFVQVGDQSAELELVVFPNVYQRLGAQLAQGAILLVTGKVELRNNNKNLLVSDFRSATDFSEKCYYLRLTQQQTQVKAELNQIIKAHQGNVPVILIEEYENRKIILKEKLWLSDDEQTLEALSRLLGSKNVILK